MELMLDEEEISKLILNGRVGSTAWNQYYSIDITCTIFLIPDIPGEEFKIPPQKSVLRCGSDKQHEESYPPFPYCHKSLKMFNE